jgi:molecular chaperone GrpE (heat shock protein)
MVEEHEKSTELAREFDIVEEMENTLDDMEKAIELAETDEVSDKISYLRFLVKDLDKALSGEHEDLRQRKFLIKREG